MSAISFKKRTTTRDNGAQQQKNPLDIREFRYGVDYLTINSKLLGEELILAINSGINSENTDYKSKLLRFINSIYGNKIAVYFPEEIDRLIPYKNTPEGLSHIRLIHRAKLEFGGRVIG